VRILVAAALGFGVFVQASFATEPAPLTLRTASTLVFFHRPQDVAEMERRLDFCLDSPANQVSGRESRLPGRCEARLAAKIEVLLARVSKLLYLTAPTQSRLHIRLLADGLAVRRHYALHHDRNTALAYHPLEAYYDAAGRTIYLSLADLRPGILAHELAHYLFCTALPRPPPRQVQEEWAGYAETRIFWEGK
jgi:hypothetical protein